MEEKFSSLEAGVGVEYPYLPALLEPGAYPHNPEKVELCQTQMSFVFLTGEYAYKVRKAINLGYLDYSSLEKRLFFCRREVELNRRLSPNTYLAVVPIVEEGGRFSVEGEGKAVEYAVKMKQLPRERMMDVLLSRGQVDEGMIVKVAEKLGGFHRRAETNPQIASYGRLDVIQQNNRENFSQTEKYIDVSITSERHSRLKEYTENFIKDNAGLFARRVNEGKVRDCHGDLHAAHVCFAGDIVIYDCIEFNDRFRYSDVASEVAFLAMDLDRYRRPDLSKCFVDTYVELSHDDDLLELLGFYKCYRACVRGKVESFKLDDSYIPEEEKRTILTTARRYFDLAALYSRTKPLLLMVMGLMGTGKTTVAQSLGYRFGFLVTSSDVVRKHLAGVSPAEHHFEEFHSGIYAEDFSSRTYEEMFREASDALSQGRSVILDASFSRKESRLKARELARDGGADFMVLECVLDEDEIKRRLDKRLEEESASDGRREIFQWQKDEFQPVTEFSPRQHLVIDTSPPRDELEEILWRKF
ncbi:MAG: AAA family ATPase [Dehalococcoidia bacterium]|nr:AAA family ATPase [Dehalococcoidia bacterium]